mgnify:CR=1 FL=1|jgi:hypothetical protein
MYMGHTKDVFFQGSRLAFKEFKLKHMCHNPSIAIIAKRNSGKSWVCRNILRHLDEVHKIPGGCVIAPTDEMNSFYSAFFPNTYIHYKYRSETLAKILSRQKYMKGKSVEKKKAGKKLDPRAFLIMDDCLGTKGSWVNDEEMTKVFFNGRHYDLTYILTMQFPLGIKPEFRTNFDYIFLLAEDFTSNRKRIFDHYAGMFPDFKIFNYIFSQMTKDYCCMVVLNQGAAENFMDKIYWYKAKNIEEKDELIGCKQFRDFHNKNFNPTWNEDDDIIDINKILTKRGKTLDFKIDKVENE